MLQDLKHVLQSAARLVFLGTNHQPKLQLALHLISHGNQTPCQNSWTCPEIGIEDAAAVTGLEAYKLLPLLRADGCFLVQVPDGRSSLADVRVTLNTPVLLSKARQSTSTGVLFAELAPPAGWVEGVYPLRPGQPDCTHYFKTGKCAYKQKCVFNHGAFSQSGQASQPYQRTSPPADSAAGVSSHVTVGNGTNMQPGPVAQQAAAAVAAGSAGPMAAAPAQHSARPCPMFIMRGICPAGVNCPYDHPQRTGTSNSNNTVSMGSTCTPAAMANAPQGPSAYAAAAAAAAAGEASSTQQPRAATVVSPVASSSSSGSVSGSTAAAAAAAGPLRVLTSPDPAAQQEQQEQQKRFPMMGRNELGLPHLRGAPSCPYYMGTGTCAFKNGCKYHHPSHALHPECLLQGLMPRKFNVQGLVSYARLVNHTERLWDYESCPEAQLKIWLARHLLAKENPGCSMFDGSAARAAASEVAPGGKMDPDRPLGPYSCTLDEAGQLLQALWKAQPDEAAKQPMPWGKKLRELLAGDPYYDLAKDSKRDCQWVRLRVSRIKELLNF